MLPGKNRKEAGKSLRTVLGVGQRGRPPPDKKCLARGAEAAAKQADFPNKGRRRDRGRSRARPHLTTRTRLNARSG